MWTQGLFFEARRVSIAFEAECRYAGSRSPDTRSVRKGEPHGYGHGHLRLRTDTSLPGSLLAETTGTASNSQQ